MSFNVFNCNCIEHLLSCHKAAEKRQNSKLYLQVREKLLPSVFVFINTREWPFQLCTEKVQIYVILLLPNLNLSVFDLYADSHAQQWTENRNAFK